MAHLESPGAGGEAKTPSAITETGVKAEEGERYAPKREHWLPAGLVLGGLTLWELATRAGWLSALFFPAPSFVLLALMRMAGTSDFWLALGLTLFRLVMGVVVGGSAGLLLGWLMGANHAVRVALGPVVAVLHPLPKLAIFPIFLVLLGLGEESKIALVALTAFFPLLINTLAGIQQIDRAYWEVATNYGATARTLLRRVILPGSLPMMFTGLKLAANGALIITVSVEMLSARQGLGAQIWLDWQTLRTAELYATLVVIASLGLVSNALFNFAARKLMPWQGKDSEHEQLLNSI